MDPRNGVLDGIMGVHIPMRTSTFEGEGGCLVVKLGILCGHLCKNGRTDRDAFWVIGWDGIGPRNHVLDGGLESRSPWEGVILREKGAARCKV